MVERRRSPRTTRCARVAQPPVTPSGAVRAAARRPLPDMRSLFLGYHYSFAKLPDEPMRPRARRRAHRLLHDDALRLLERRPRCRRASTTSTAGASRRRIRRRRCRSRSSRSSSGSTATSRSSTAPTIVAGILEWNKAFEQHRLQGRDPGRDAARRRRLRHARRAPRVDPLDRHQRGRASAASARRSVDPRTGEILDADIGIDAGAHRATAAPPARRAVRRADGGARPHAAARRARAVRVRRRRRRAGGGFALDLLEARGDIDPDGPEAERVRARRPEGRGDARGRPHARPARTTSAPRRSTREAQLDDPEFTRTNGIAGSVMDYNASTSRSTERAAGRVRR